ncbi:redoxin domain-containing protein [soil metagenome]
MKSALMAAAAAVAIIAVAGVASLPASHGALAAATPMAVQHVDNFQLTDSSLMAYDLYYYAYKPAIVIMTQSNGTKLSHEAALELQKIDAAYKDKGVLTLMLNSNLTDSRDAVAAWAKAQGVTLPILVDEEQLVGEQLGVQKEGEVYVINPKTWTVAYRGPIDDRFSAASPNVAAKAKDAYVTKALDALIAGSPVQTASADSKAGKPVAFPEKARAAEFANISYSKTIAPIIQDKCVSCHLKGGIGPFPMDGYNVVKGMAPMIRETVRTRRMPPYFADPHIGLFQNDQGLTGAQAKTLVHWIEAGAPRGEGADPLLANAGKVAPDWPVELGKPDVIVDLPSFNVPASGIVAYQNQRVANPFKDNTWLRAIAMKPGDRSVLHHVVSNQIPDPNLPRAAIPGGSVGSYTPGARPQVMADGSGAPVPGGGQLNFQMHYTTTGKPVTDKTQVGFYVLKAPPQYIKRSTVISDPGLTIPAGEARHKEIAYLTFPADAYLYTLYPHSHYRGMHVELKAKTPDGKETMLLALPKYDFNWQRDYDPVKPILVKAGTKLIATWVYDNSDHNKANPDPKKTVTWGEQTFQEMMYFRINYRWADETVDHLRNDLQTALQASANIGALDDNADDLVQITELRGSMASLKSKFAELDKDHNGGLDKTELAGVNTRAMSRQRNETPDL